MEIENLLQKYDNELNINNRKDSFSLEEFIQYTKDNKDAFIGYCEIIIDDECNIHLALPSHQEKLIELFIKKCNLSSKEEALKLIPVNFAINKYIIDKLNIVCLWYNHVCVPIDISQEQADIINKLIANNILSKNISIDISYEYKLMKCRKILKEI